MNKKGFTLVELLAIIVILVIIVSIAVKSFYSVRMDSLEELLKAKITEIESGAELYGQNNQDKLTEGCTINGETFNFCAKVTIGELLDGDYVESKEKETTISGLKRKDLINNVTNKSMRCDVVWVYRKNNRIYGTVLKNDDKYILNSYDKTCVETISGVNYNCTCE